MTAQELTDIRLSLQLTPAQLSRALRVRPETVWRWEHGAQPISQKSATKVLQLAGLSICPTCGQAIRFVSEANKGEISNGYE